MEPPTRPPEKSQFLGADLCARMRSYASVCLNDNDNEDDNENDNVNDNDNDNDDVNVNEHLRCRKNRTEKNKNLLTSLKNTNRIKI